MLPQRLPMLKARTTVHSQMVLTYSPITHGFYSSGGKLKNNILLHIIQYILNDKKNFNEYLTRKERINLRL